jgi:hypothetical protein
VPLGNQPSEMARARLQRLVTYECATYPNEMWKWGSAAVKLGQLFFSLKAGGEPTRHKEDAFANF